MTRTANRIGRAAALLAVVLIASAATRAQTFQTSAGPIALTTVARGLVHPWALQFLPDGRMLVSERPGRMRIVDREGNLSAPLAGVPPVRAGGQGGLTRCTARQ